jgi:hypothetical protein
MPQPPSFLFAGPTYAALRAEGGAERLGFELRPPAARGDIDALRDAGPCLIVLVDGRFNQSIAVGHAELRRALERGCEVWGLSSMGAIRAYEMRTLGMRGFGVVYEHFVAADDFQDDEVALLHMADEPYTSFSEPLVHLRHGLAALEREGALSRSSAEHVAAALKSRWFAERTLDAFVQLVDEYGGGAAGDRARAFAADFGRFRVKTNDLANFFATQPWLTQSHTAGATPAPYLDAASAGVA